MNRVGLFFGSFDPPHIGHANVVMGVVNSKLVDKVLVIPAYQNVWKSNSSEFSYRLAMCRMTFSPLAPEVYVESNLQSIFDKAGLKFKIHSITPFGSHRGCEIQEWLDSQTEPYVYAIVDDDRDMLSHQRKYFIKTNTAIGITDEDVRHIINILNRNDMWNDKLNVMIADSMKKHDTTRTNVYRAIKTAFTNYAAAKNAKPLDEAAEISIIKKMRDERWANAETYQTAGRMDLSAVEADEAEILEELLPKEPTKEELNAALLKLALDKGWYDDNEEHDIHPVQIPKNQMGIAVKELKAKYPAADGKKIADLVKANLCN